MVRAKRIALRGWRRALNIATFGYYPFHDVAIGKTCIGDITMTIPTIALIMTVPSATIEFEDCS